MSDSNLTVGNITSSYYSDDKHGISIEKIAQESQLKAKDNDFDYGWIYYVVIGHLEDYQTWKQDYIMPFKNSDDAEIYIKNCWAESSMYQAFIVKQNMIRPICFF